MANVPKSAEQEETIEPKLGYFQQSEKRVVEPVPPHLLPKLLTPKQVADQLHVSVDWVQAHATRKEPRIDYIRVGKLLRFAAQHVSDFVRRNAVLHKR